MTKISKYFGAMVSLSGGIGVVSKATKTGRQNKTCEQKRKNSMQPGPELCALFGIAPQKDNQTDFQHRLSKSMKAKWKYKKETHK